MRRSKKEARSLRDKNKAVFSWYYTYLLGECNRLGSDIVLTRRYTDFIYSHKQCRRTNRYDHSHHVIPRCCGGEDGIQVWLSEENHGIAHNILCADNPGHKGLRAAATMTRVWFTRHASMTKGNSLKEIKSNIIYGERNNDFEGDW